MSRSIGELVRVALAERPQLRHMGLGQSRIDPLQDDHQIETRGHRVWMIWENLLHDREDPLQQLMRPDEFSTPEQSDRESSLCLQRIQMLVTQEAPPRGQHLGIHGTCCRRFSLDPHELGDVMLRYEGPTVLWTESERQSSEYGFFDLTSPLEIPEGPCEDGPIVRIHQHPGVLRSQISQ